MQVNYYKTRRRNIPEGSNLFSFYAGAYSLECIKNALHNLRWKFFHILCVYTLYNLRCEFSQLLFIHTFSGKGVGGVGVKCIMAGLQPPELVQVFIHLLQRVNAHYIHRNA